MKIAVLVSGGVDSSVALALLKEAGHDVTAFYLKIWLEDELSYLGGECPWEEDLSYARAVCEKLDVPLQVLNLQKEYWERVVSYTISELKAGRTPNPDMLCNARIKFGVFYDKIDQMFGDSGGDGGSFEKVATGHYAQIETVMSAGGGARASEASERYLLKKSADAIKDQTYFLSYLSQKQLSRALFPIGGYTKPEVRELARKFDLPTKDRKDSQGICFLGTIKFSDFVKHHLGERRGELIDIRTGEIVGEHQGYWYFTIGQRHGIKLSGGPWYVTGKDIGKNIVYIGLKNDVPEKATEILHLSDFNSIAPLERQHVGVRIRHTGTIYDAQIGVAEAANTKPNQNLTLKLATPLADLAPGQFATLYDGDICLGAGRIAIHRMKALT